jgi:hypothetical protein
MLPSLYLSERIRTSNNRVLIDSTILLSLASGVTIGASYGSGFVTPLADRMNFNGLLAVFGGAAAGGLLGAASMCIGRRTLNCFGNPRGVFGAAIGASIGVPVGIWVGKLRGISFTHPRSPDAVVFDGKISAPSVLR